MSKARDYYQSIYDARQEWKLSFDKCMYCGSKEMLEVHEIERRSHSPRRWGQECNYLLLCQPCHAGEFATMPHAKQLAVKWLNDKGDYTLLDSFLKAWRRIGKRPESYVTVSDVTEAIVQLKGMNDS